jgi:copper(I)-binding protein
MLLLALCGAAVAGELGQAPATIVLHQAWVRRLPPMGQVEQGSHGGSMVSPDTTAAYVTIENHAHAPDALLAASSPIATSSALHVTRLRDGITEMHVQSQFAIPAGGQLTLHPGGAHIMLLGLTQALHPGDSVSLVLTFQQAGAVAVEAVVK